MVSEHHCITINKSLNSRPMSKTNSGNTGHVARNQVLDAAPTCGNVRASSSFIEKVTGKGGRTDDEKARSQGGHYPQKQQDCPEATVNWKPKNKRKRRLAFNGAGCPAGEFVLH